jgi:hypothetical protein
METHAHTRTRAHANVFMLKLDLEGAKLTRVLTRTSTHMRERSARDAMLREHTHS